MMLKSLERMNEQFAFARLRLKRRSGDWFQRGKDPYIDPPGGVVRIDGGVRHGVWHVGSIVEGRSEIGQRLKVAVGQNPIGLHGSGAAVRDDDHLPAQQVFDIDAGIGQDAARVMIEHLDGEGACRAQVDLIPAAVVSQQRQVQASLRLPDHLTERRGAPGNILDRIEQHLGGWSPRKALLEGHDLHQANGPG